MRVIIAGSRHCQDARIVVEAVKESGWWSEITEIVSGGAKGVDTIGEEIAKAGGIPCTRFPADWGRYGLGAGPKRNGEMAEYADALIAVLYPGSRGTANMIKQARAKGLRVFVKEVESP